MIVERMWPTCIGLATFGELKSMTMVFGCATFETSSPVNCAATKAGFNRKLMKPAPATVGGSQMPATSSWAMTFSARARGFSLRCFATAMMPLRISSLMMSTVFTFRYSASSLTERVGGSWTLPSLPVGLASAGCAPGANWVRTAASWSELSTAIAWRGACRIGRRKSRMSRASTLRSLASCWTLMPRVVVVAMSVPSFATQQAMIRLPCLRGELCKYSRPKPRPIVAVQLQM